MLEHLISYLRWKWIKTWLSGRLFNYLIVEPERDPDTKFSRRDFLDAIKIVEGLSDDGPAKDRLGVLISRGLCVGVGPGVTGMTKFDKIHF